MEVNKGEAERCRDMGAQALRNGDNARAVKLLGKSLKLYPLPGVEVLLSQAVGQLRNQHNGESASNGSSNSTTNNTSRQEEENARPTNNTTAPSAPASRSSTPQQQQSGADGRAYSDEQVQVVKRVLASKEGGRGAHYRVLGISRDATETQIKKAYRKLSLKVHPDKNAAPHSDEAFKAVGLAYATLSDSQKRHIYDRYGEEDPDNRGGGARGPGGMHMGRPGEQVSPEEIFNMFFGGGGMPGMNQRGGFHVHSTGFGPGVQFRAGGGGRPRAQQRGQQAEGEAPGLGLLLQFLPILLIAALSFMKFNEDDAPRGVMPGENKYFSLTNKRPFTNLLSTRLTEVKDIPYYVSDRFLQTYNRNRYQLGQVETMVERAYEQYLVEECKSQIIYKKKLETSANEEPVAEEKERKLERANSFELSRCSEMEDLFPRRKQGTGYRSF